MRQLINLFCLACLFSCSKHLVVPTVSSQNTMDEIPVKANDNIIINILDSLSQIKPKTFYSKLSVNYIDSLQDIRFKTSLKMIADSAINAIISYANIPVALASISKDTIVIVNKRDRCYSKQSLNYFNELLGLDLTINNLQEIFLGKPLYYDKCGTKSITIDSLINVSSSVTRPQEERSIFLNYSLKINDNKLNQVEINIPSDKTSVQIQYLSWQDINGISVPYEMNLIINSEQNQTIMRIVFEKVEINNPLELIFIIPEQYEACN